ncbi:MAG: hypothetical protein ACPG05_02085, partial [Bdellovibrionales bacterium]
EAGQVVKETFIEARSMDDGEPYMINPKYAQIKEETTKSGVAIIELPNGSSVHLVENKNSPSMKASQAELALQRKNFNLH